MLDWFLGCLSLISLSLSSVSCVVDREVSVACTRVSLRSCAELLYHFCVSPHQKVSFSLCSHLKVTFRLFHLRKVIFSSPYATLKSIDFNSLFSLQIVLNSIVCLVVRGFILFLNIKAFYKNQVFHSQHGKHTGSTQDGILGVVSVRLSTSLKGLWEAAGQDSWGRENNRVCEYFCNQHRVDGRCSPVFMYSPMHTHTSV